MKISLKKKHVSFIKKDIKIQFLTSFFAFFFFMKFHAQSIEKSKDEGSVFIAEGTIVFSSDSIFTNKIVEADSNAEQVKTPNKKKKGKIKKTLAVARNKKPAYKRHSVHFIVSDTQSGQDIVNGYRLADNVSVSTQNYTIKKELTFYYINLNISLLFHLDKIYSAEYYQSSEYILLFLSRPPPKDIFV
ncbi:hypothetical protein ACM40_13905 [Chryseobacterium sp. BLS98]|uniref:hypothetical protein n=1 Tax=Chryseobacterium sp. BLS98 TaxID=885586 RepID=UPI00065AF6E0|nr:hypothetical protein [Chryseobacterium sp. BLS98]KMQ60818.1 hypothetical protein ACM40_13905 [Chryseobacterium sp. BLS98]